MPNVCIWSQVVPTLLPSDMLTKSDAPPQWLVQDFLYQGSLVVLAGDPGVGKSVLGYTAAIAISAGLPLLGLLTTPSRVLYFDEENSEPDATRYFRWAWRGLDGPDIPTLDAALRFEHFSLSSYNGPWWDCMAQAAREHRPGLIIVDTSTPACRIADENSNAEATSVIKHLRLVQLAADSATTMLVLKHARLTHDPIGQEYRTVRGAKAWVGAPDGVIFHVASRGKPRADGLRATHLEPQKTRAWGLRRPLHINPIWKDGEADASKGLVLTASFNAPDPT